MERKVSTIEVEIINDAESSYLRTVQRRSYRPMGRFSKWCIEHTNTKCDVVKVISVEGANHVNVHDHFVLDMVGQNIGRIYVCRKPQSDMDVLQEEDMCYEVFQLKKVRANRYEMNISPVSSRVNHAQMEFKRRQSSQASIEPLWGSWFVIFLENQHRLEGRVTWVSEGKIDVVINDDSHHKTWMRVSRARTGVESNEAPQLRRYDMEFNHASASWEVQITSVSIPVSRLSYCEKSSLAEDWLAVKYHVAEVAPNGFSYLVQAASQHTSPRTNRQAQVAVRYVPVVLTKGDEEGTLYKLERVATNVRAPHTFPWSVTDLLHTRSRSKTASSSLVVSLGLQASKNVRRSWLKTIAPDRDLVRQSALVLLPTLYELQNNPLSSCDTNASAVLIHLTSHDPKSQLQFCQDQGWIGTDIHLQILSDASVTSRHSRKMRTLILKASDAVAKKLEQVLVGQALVAYDKSSLRQIDEHTNPILGHWAHMGSAWEYSDTSSEFHSWTPSLYHEPLMVTNDHPYPLLHAEMGKAGKDDTIGHKSYMLDSLRKYYPDNLLHSDAKQLFETFNNCLRTIRAPPHSNVRHQQFLKNISGNGFKALRAIDQLHQPSWMNVDDEAVVNNIAPLDNQMSADTLQKSNCFFVEPNVHTRTCDRRGRSESLYFTKFPDEDADAQTERFASCSLLADRADVRDTKLGQDDAVYGICMNEKSELPALSHYLFGSQNRPHRGPTETYQRKPSRIYKYANSIAPKPFFLKGICRHARFESRRVAEKARVWTVRVRTSEPKQIECNATSSDAEYSLERLAKSLQYALSKAFPKSAFTVTVNTRGHAVLTANSPFTILDGGSCWAIPNRSEARLDSISRLYELQSACPIDRGLNMIGSDDRIRNVGSTRTVHFTYQTSVGDTDSVDSDLSLSSADGEVVQIEFNIKPCTDTYPFEDPNTSRFRTVTGRAGFEKYMSKPVHAHIIHMMPLKPSLLVVVRPFTVSIVHTQSNKVLNTYNLHWVSQHTSPHDVWVTTYYSSSLTALHSFTIHNRTDPEKRYTVKVDVQDSIVVNEAVTKDAPAELSNRNLLTRLCIQGLKSNELLDVEHACSALSGDPELRILKYTASKARASVHTIPCERCVRAATLVPVSSTGQIRLFTCDVERNVYAYTFSNMHMDNMVDARTTPWFQCPLEKVHLPTSFPTAVCVLTKNDDSCVRCYVGYETQSVVQEYEMEFVPQKASASVAAHKPLSTVKLSTTEELVKCTWWWSRLVTSKAPHHHLTVELSSSKSIYNITHEDCRQSFEKASLVTDLSSWFKQPQESTDVSYVFEDAMVNENLPLYRYLAKHVVGYRSADLPQIYDQFICQASNRSRVVADPLYHLHAYMQQRPAADASHNWINYEIMQKMDTKGFAKVQQSCERYTNMLVRKFGSGLSSNANRSSPSNSKYSLSQLQKSLAPKERTAVFYAKIQKLLRSRPGTDYLRTKYEESVGLRKKFVGCTCYCYQKLLYKLGTLRCGTGRGFVDSWSDTKRDETTFLVKGENYYICKTCGEQVCPQDSGLTLEFDVVGMSSTHTKSGLGTTTATDTKEDMMTDTKDVLLATSAAIWNELSVRDLTFYKARLEYLLVTPIIATFLLRKTNKLSMKPIQSGVSTFKDVQVHFDAKHPDVVVHLYKLAMTAMLQVMKSHGITRIQSWAEEKHNAGDQTVIDALAKVIKFAPHELKTGIKPRPSFRPILDVNTGMKMDDNWIKVNRAINETAVVPVFDASSFDTSITPWLVKFQYVNFVRNVTDTNDFTCVFDLLSLQHTETTDRFKRDPVLYHMNMSEYEKICPYLSQSFPFFLPTVRGKHQATACEESHMPRPLLPLSRLRYVSRLTDAQCRKQIAEYVHRNASDANVRLSYPIQLLLDQKFIDKTNEATKLLWVVGLMKTKRLNITSYPSTDYFNMPAWGTVYDQFDSDNKTAYRLVTGAQCAYQSSYLDNRLAAMYGKYFSGKSV